MNNANRNSFPPEFRTDINSHIVSCNTTQTPQLLLPRQWLFPHTQDGADIRAELFRLFP